jgi:tRNA A-37 threonylcarbamoyl transferase component Bud32
LHQNSIINKKDKEKKNNNDENIKLIPAYKQEKEFFLPNENNSRSESFYSSNKKRDEIEQNIKDNIYFEEEEEEENDEEEEDDASAIEGYLYKYINDKMKPIWFKLIHKDLYFFKNKNDKHKGMHNLSGLFLNQEKNIKCENKKYYGFSINYPSKKRFYYVNNEEDFKKWFEKLKVATGYTNLLDIYEVKEKLGNGKFGLVKLGINKQTKEKVAIKIMNKKKMDTSDIELMRTEIEILKICQHPNIIRLYNVFENADYLYIIMEYCYGGDLFSYLENRHFRLSEKRASTIIHQMATAVYYMHSFGVVHRDLKPENVLMTSTDEDSDIRILDFGLSKILGPYEKCDEPYGTLTYCAPEIIIDEPYSKPVDLWSLGVMTYLMVSGKLPFNAEDENEIARQVVYDEPNYTRNPIWKTISPECLDFIQKLLIKDQNKRMTIKGVLEHKWIKMYDENKLSEKRQSIGGGEKDFELYSSYKDSENKKE